MEHQELIKNMKSSWTKYDSVQVIDLINTEELNKEDIINSGLNSAIVKNFFCIANFKERIPDFWHEVIKYPNERKLFALLATLFTHYQNIEDFAEKYSNTQMGGTFIIRSKQKKETNIRSALVESGAAPNSDRRKKEVSYDLSTLYQNGNLGKLFKQLLFKRLLLAGFSENHIEKEFYSTIKKIKINSAASLDFKRFKDWLEGNSLEVEKKPKFSPSEFKNDYQEVTLMKINQWLDNWNDIDFESPLRRKPEKNFYFFKIDIRLLKRIADVHRRKADKPRKEEVLIQRAHKNKRSNEIRNFVQGGFPWSTLTEEQRKSDDVQPLKNPGFLPTAIIANILGPEEKRGKKSVREEDLIQIKDKDKSFPSLVIPDNVFRSDWSPPLKPLEIIDGQHRLWAFREDEEINGQFEVPVIAYYNLDRAWQAYLFYTINVKPEKINTSLGYDLYPLLRTQEWLNNAKEGLKVYRETRAQELVETLWSYEGSPFFGRINMLGQNPDANISQAAFIRALSKSFLKKTSQKQPVSGLFSDLLRNKNEEIRWIRAQQSAFLILLWNYIAEACSPDFLDDNWAKKIREEKLKDDEVHLDKAFISKKSMLSRDQGVTAISEFANDFFFLLADSDKWDFNELEWLEDVNEKEISQENIDFSIKRFQNHKINSILKEFSMEIVHFDWRSSSAKFDNENERENQARYRGSGGYKALYQDLTDLFLNSEQSSFNSIATLIKKLYNF